MNGGAPPAFAPCKNAHGLRREGSASNIGVLAVTLVLVTLSTARELCSWAVRTSVAVAHRLYRGSGCGTLGWLCHPHRRRSVLLAREC